MPLKKLPLKVPRGLRFSFAAVSRPRHCVLLAFGAALISGCGGEPQKPQAPRPPALVSTVNVQPEPAIQYGEYPARIRSTGKVDVRAQVNGILEQRFYTEGQLTTEGQALFQIDREPYALALKRAESQVAEAQASLLQAEREWTRAQDLFSRKVASEHDKDKAETAKQVALARLNRARAAVDDAKRLLRYSRVEAPVSGITSLEAVPEGNLVEAGTLLTTVTPLDPIEVHFSLPSADLRSRKNLSSDSTVILQLADGTVFPHKGELNFTSSSVDPRTDSVQLRAVFPNPDADLLPGQFVRVQVPVQEFRNVFLIDPQAVSEGPNGAQVFTVDAENTARIRPVKLGPVLDGRQVVVSGLSRGDQLVINGHLALRPGQPVVEAASKEVQP